MSNCLVESEHENLKVKKNKFTRWQDDIQNIDNLSNGRIGIIRVENREKGHLWTNDILLYSMLNMYV